MLHCTYVLRVKQYFEQLFQFLKVQENAITIALH